jgi:sortase B
MKEKKEKRISIPLLIFRLISLAIIIVCSVILIRWQIQNNENKDIQSSLSSTVTYDNTSASSGDSPIKQEFDAINVDFNSLLEQNPDTVAWVKIKNTNIEFPVVQTTDNDFYLKHNFSKKYNGAGWIFADYNCKFDNLSQNTIVYGHNRRNGTMFSNLGHLLDESWSFDGDNSYFYFFTPNAKYKATIFSIYMIKADGLTITSVFSSDTEFLDYINTIKERSEREFKETIINGDSRIITLCTCDNTSKNRILVHALLEEVK